jgi:hypothetical protein
MEGMMGTMLLTKFKMLAATLVVGCAVAVTAVAGWRADAAGTGTAEQPKATDAPKRAAPNPDKERIAELERERERLLKELAELKDRLAKVEAEQRQRSKERALAEMLDRNANRTPDAVPKTPVPGSNLPAPAGSTSLFAAPAPKSPEAFDPTPKGTNFSRPPQDTTGSGPKMGSSSIPNQPSGVTSGAIVRVYSVGELAADEKEGEALVKVVRATVEPKSWGVDAGVEYLPGRKILVVRQTENAHKEVAELLRLLQTQGKPPAPAQGK